MTLLDLTQNILSSLSSDEVNSISDTTESLQVATIVKNKYFDIISRVDLPEHDQFIQLDPSLDSSIPVEMFVPDGVAALKWLKYFNSNANDNVTSGSHDINTDIVSTINWSTTSTTSNTIAFGHVTFTVASSSLPVVVGQNVQAANGVNSMTGSVVSYVGSTLVLNITSIIGAGTFATWVIQTVTANPVPGYQYVTILPIKQFVDMVNAFNPEDGNVSSFEFADTVNGFPGNYVFYYKTDRQPNYCCILSNYNVIFDSYDSTQDSTLQASKTMAWGKIIPVFLMEDSFIPNLDDEQFTLLLNEAKALAYFEMKQSVHPKAEQEIKRGWSSVQKNKAIINRPTYFNELPNFGRRSGNYYGTRGFGNRVNNGSSI